MDNRSVKSLLKLEKQVKGSNASIFAGSALNAFSFWTIALLSVFLSHSPGFSWLFAPINVFTTAVHEMGHALVCIATGGHVAGLTIVGDGAGHGGLTFCQGGIPFFYNQAGYLGAAVFGCILILLGQYPKLSKAILVAIGLTIGLASVFLMPGALFQDGQLLQGLCSIVWAVAMSAALIWSGVKLKPALANILLLFLAVQTALNSVSCIGDLLTLSLGLAPIQTFSDATLMADMTLIPAFLWSIFWGAASVVMLGFTLKETYGRQLFAKQNSKA